jgi:hypothetical protein
MYVGALVGGGQRHTSTNRQAGHSPALGINEQNRRLTNLIIALVRYTPGGFLLGISMRGRAERARVPIGLHLFLLPGGGYPTPTNCRSPGGKDPGPAFEGIEERLEFLRKRRAYFEHPGRDQCRPTQLVSKSRLRLSSKSERRMT